MDAILEALLQLVLEVLGEIAFEAAYEGAFRGVAALLARRSGRWVLGFAAGLGFGCAWGAHLSGHPHYPRLLWVSLIFGVAAAAVAPRRPPRSIGQATSSPDQGLGGLAPERPVAPRAPLGRRLRGVLTDWSRDRLVGLVCINAGLALGVVLVFRRG